MALKYSIGTGFIKIYLWQKPLTYMLLQNFVFEIRKLNPQKVK